MKRKLYANMRRMTTIFCIGVLCVTACVIVLRLTVFSDMASVPESANSNLISSKDAGYRINSKIYFSSATSKGDIFVTNLGTENLIRVQVRLAGGGEPIMSTGLIKSGSSQPSIQMNPDGQKLAVGKYDCIAEISAYLPSDVRASIGSANVPVEVYIGQRPDKKAGQSSAPANNTAQTSGSSSEASSKKPSQPAESDSSGSADESEFQKAN